VCTLGQGAFEGNGRKSLKNPDFHKFYPTALSSMIRSCRIERSGGVLAKQSPPEKGNTMPQLERTGEVIMADDFGVRRKIIKRQEYADLPDGLREYTYVHLFTPEGKRVIPIQEKPGRYVVEGTGVELVLVDSPTL
jgi:hypothetical protein